jgi:hypothetical protein
MFFIIAQLAIALRKKHSQIIYQNKHMNNIKKKIILYMAWTNVLVYMDLSTHMKEKYI